MTPRTEAPVTVGHLLNLPSTAFTEGLLGSGQLAGNRHLIGMQDVLPDTVGNGLPALLLSGAAIARAQCILFEYFGAP